MSPKTSFGKRPRRRASRAHLQEISAQGSLSGALLPAAPAEAEVYAAQVDQKLKEEGFEQGLNTNFPTPEEAQARRLPSLIVAAKHFDEAKKLVKKARAETRDFARAIQKWNRKQFKAAAAELEEYAETYPKSPWTPEAMLHVADYAKLTTQGNSAEDFYRRALGITSNDPGETSYGVHRKALRDLADLYIVEGRYGEARSMLEEVLRNDTDWNRRTWARYWLSQLNVLASDPRRLLAQRDCGTQALAVLLAQTDHPHQARQVRALRPKDARGFSLANLSEISRHRGVPLVGFAATPAQLSHLSLPVILHYGRKNGKGNGQAQTSAVSDKSVVSLDARRKAPAAASFEHFVLVRSYNARQDEWNVLDPQGGTSATLTSRQLLKQWSGRGLMLAKPFVKRDGLTPEFALAPGQAINVSFRNPTPAPPARLSSRLSSIRFLSPSQMGSTFGAQFLRPPNSLGLESSHVPIMGSYPAKGSPAVSVSPMSQNIFITDTPLWYSPSKGPDVQITMSYNSMSASGNERRVAGTKWMFSCGSYIQEVPSNSSSSGNAVVFMPDGSQSNFIGKSVVNGVAYYIRPRGVFSELTKDVTTGTMTLKAPSGDLLVYRGSPAAATQPTTFAPLIRETDQWGNSLTFQHGFKGSYEVPISITDADGGVTSLTYDEGSGLLLYATTPDGKQAGFSYSNGEMVQCIDADGQAFQYSYNGDAIVSQINTLQGSWNYISGYKWDSNDKEYVTNITNPQGNSRVVGWSAQRTYDGPGYETTGHFYSTDYWDKNIAYSERTHEPETHASEVKKAVYNETVYYVTKLAEPSISNGYVSALSRVEYPHSVDHPGGVTVSYNYNSASTLDPTDVYTESQQRIKTKYVYNSYGLTSSVTQTEDAGDRPSRTVTTTRAANGIDVTQVVVSGQLSAGATPLQQTVFQASDYVNHQPWTVTDAENHVTKTTYNGLGNPLTTTVSESGVNHTTSYFYGTSGYERNRLVGVSYDGVPMVSYQHDDSGRVKSETSLPTNQTTRYAYNNLDALTSTIYPDGSREGVEYTFSTLPGMVTDRSGKKTYYDYDVLQRLVRVQDPEGQSLQFDYDINDNRIGLLDAKGQRTRWIYDESRGIVTKCYADGKQEKVIATTGKMTRFINARNQETYTQTNAFGDVVSDSNAAWNYDGLGRCTSMSDALGNTFWTYDNLNRVRAEDGPWANDTLFYDYDDLDRLKTVNVERGGGSVDNRTFSYDPLSRLSRITASNGGFGNVGNFDFGYEGDTDKLVGVQRPNGTQTQYVYETGGLQRFLGLQNRTNGGVNQSSFLSGYNYGSFRDAYSHRESSYGNEATKRVTYDYTPDSMLKAELDNSAGTLNNPKVANQYAFDAMGNRTLAKDIVHNSLVESRYESLDAGSQGQGLNQLLETRSYDTRVMPPRLVGKTLLEYDADGNQTQVTGTTPEGVATIQVQYLYDAKSRLTDIVTIPNGDSNPSTRQEFVYDGLSRLRANKFYTRTTTGAIWTVQPDKEKRRVYDGMDVVQERNSGNAITASVTRGGNIGGILARSTPGMETVTPIDETGTTGTMMAQAPRQDSQPGSQPGSRRLRQINFSDSRHSNGSRHSKAASTPQARNALWDGGASASQSGTSAAKLSLVAIATAGGGTTTYFGYDPQGNVTTLTDAAGAVVGSYNYDAWGNLLASSGTRAADNPYRFATKEVLGGMSFFGYRFYNAGTGRWINRDPLEEDGGTNLYMGMGNNPVNSTDEYGLQAVAAVAAAAAGAGAAYKASDFQSRHFTPGEKSRLLRIESMLTYVAAMHWQKGMRNGTSTLDYINKGFPAIVGIYKTSGNKEDDQESNTMSRGFPDKMWPKRINLRATFFTDPTYKALLTLLHESYHVYRNRLIEADEDGSAEEWANKRLKEFAPTLEKKFGVQFPKSTPFVGKNGKLVPSEYTF